MNAQQSREFSQKNLQGPVIAPLLTYVHNKIECAAEKGLFDITDPLSGYDNYPNDSAQEALWVALAGEGFKVVHHPDPDLGHPCSHPYTSIFW